MEEILNLVINGIEAAIKEIPAVQKIIADWNGPEPTKEEFLARIKAAQDSLPDWT